jgi:putative transposase
MEEKINYQGHRNSYTELNEVYFWTITVREWIPLLRLEEYKMVIIDSLQWLHKNSLVQIYGFVIMPNHIHLLWNQLKMNGKEFPKNSFEKYSAHKFKSKLLLSNETLLSSFRVTVSDRESNFWQRDPLAIRVFTPWSVSHPAAPLFCQINPSLACIMREKEKK